ncbi:cell division protein ZapE [Colwellia polaris]|jgi:cell division protein ZapE|uniref:cell division protein ZapE n=1 Tax=Colwellia polaris TaxID=326537 RepID=UPI000A16FDD6|nr:cell division protein ZapE [Colwellia polaris]
MSVTEQYQQLIELNKLKSDNEQYKAALALDDLSRKLICAQKPKSILSKINNLFTKHESIQGIYFHGRVGRGKTMLMDLFYQQLKIKRKRRIHFHHFMEDVHQQLKDFSGKDNPLMLIAKVWSTQVDILCFDEFFVNDIGDAMLLAGLLKAMLSNGITLVATSNCPPKELYKNGLQRERFLPTIDVINHYCQVISIDGPTDHRLLTTEAQEYKYRDYYSGNDIENNFLLDYFNKLSQGNIRNNDNIVINNRTINFRACSDNTIWFDFMALCSGPRSQRDYIKLADNFKIILVSNVPQFSGKLIPAVFSGVEDGYQRSGVVMGQLRGLDDEARRFIALVDEFYDRGIRLIITAEVDIAELYQGTQLSFEFARCMSRLFEMQRLSYS